MLNFPKGFKYRSKNGFIKNVEKFKPYELTTAKLLSIIIDDSNYKLNDDKYYDILFVNLGTRIEVKCDTKMSETGNVFIEFSAYGEDSGINTTTSHFYCIIDKIKYYLIPTFILKYIIIGCDTRSINKLFKSGYILPFEKLKKYSIELSNYKKNI